MKTIPMIAQSADDTEFRRSIRLLVDLQHAICRDDEDEADRLRDDMEAPLRKLSWDQKEWLRGLSGDLEMLCSQEVFEPNPYLPPEHEQRIQSAYLNRDAETLLRLLRKEQKFGSKEALAFRRSRAYAWYGLYDVSTLFLDLAMNLSSDRDRYLVFALDDIFNLRNYTKLWKTTQAIFDSHAIGSGPIFIAAGKILVSINHFPLSERRNILGCLRQGLQRSLGATPDELLGVEGTTFGYVLLGLVQQTLERKKKAEEAYLAAARTSPSLDIPWLLLGNLLFADNTEKAVFCFLEAVKLDTKYPTAILAAAMVNFNRQEYNLSKSLCNRALQATNSLDSTDYRARVVAAIRQVLKDIEEAEDATSPDFSALRSQGRENRMAELVSELRTDTSVNTEFLSKWLENSSDNIQSPLSLAA